MATVCFQFLEMQSDFAVVEQNSRPISRNQFQRLTGSHDTYEQYLHHSGRHIVMGYDPQADIHYFYEQIGNDGDSTSI